MERKKLIIGCLMFCVCLLGFYAEDGYAIDKSMTPTDKQLSSERVWNDIIDRLIAKTDADDQGLHIEYDNIGAITTTAFRNGEWTEILTCQETNYKLRLKKGGRKFDLWLMKIASPDAQATLVLRLYVDNDSFTLYNQCLNLWEKAMQLYVKRIQKNKDKLIQKELHEADRAFR